MERIWASSLFLTLISLIYFMIRLGFEVADALLGGVFQFPVDELRVFGTLWVVTLMLTIPYGVSNQVRART